MGRAYKDEEKIEIRKRLLESGLQAFYDDSFKSFNTCVIFFLTSSKQLGIRLLTLYIATTRIITTQESIYSSN